ncbi:hypothetical protein PE066_13950 [Ramlibacter tataouinensis]|uniref:hypothetical protein n=1 Tax=Ramlibacter tataouinensis TaxID=94132 RepID=UPI0022F3EF92|nr:hypothetical protein [Ramlibacter tataouinensis]WBY00566.1 hypothetical protein PE066_13950 [Ramlibacter tataouinensis]
MIEESTEDLLKLGGLEAMPKPYLDIPLAEMIKKRGRLAHCPFHWRDAHRERHAVLPG